MCTGASRATCRPRWFRLFPVTAAHQAKFVRGSHEKGSAGNDDSVNPEQYEKDKWWRLNPPRQYLRGGVFETNQDELALEAAQQDLLKSRAQDKTNDAALKAGAEVARARNFYTGVEGGEYCGVQVSS